MAEPIDVSRSAVEPIPWKGKVGVVDALDAKPTPAAAPKPSKPKKLDPKLPGSGIPARKSIRVLKWVRRASQVGFFALFMYFLFHTGFRGSFAASADQAVRLPLPVEAYLLADPFVAAMTALSTHTVYRGLLWSLGLLALTLVFGRVFCGWICPFGTLHHFFGWLLPSRRGRGAARVEANKTHGYQRAKYYMLYAFLILAIAGSALGGMFDPICIAVRSIGLGVIPAAQGAGPEPKTSNSARKKFRTLPSTSNDAGVFAEPSARCKLVRCSKRNIVKLPVTITRK